MDNELRFEFGKNWEKYVESCFSKERLEIASTKLLKLLQLTNLEDFTFLDIGCGSGIHSLAALEAGAKQVVSFDYDENSVKTTKKLHKMIGSPSNWTILQGSVLDKEFMKQLGSFDIVYSWGVLHHTGDMWKAIENARIPLSDDGVFAIALYTDTGYRSGSISGWPTPEKWLEIKKEYNCAGPLRKKIMELQQVWRSSQCWQADSVGDFFSKLHSFIDKVRWYSARRGMSYWHDLRDWLGGWPMEFAKESECMSFCTEKLGLEILRIRTGEGNTEYVFRPESAHNYWDAMLKNKKSYSINNSPKHETGFMWSVDVNDTSIPSDEATGSMHSPLVLCVDNVPLSYAHSPINAIKALGDGRYRHVDGKVYFSTQGNISPEQLSGRISYYLDTDYMTL